MTATYSTNQDLYLAFGTHNVRKWADVDNDAVYSSLEARLDWARAQAYDELNSKLVVGPYPFPLVAPYPPIVVRMEAYLAGVLLYESRGVVDVDERGQAMHALMWHRKRVEEFIRDIYARRITLPSVPTLASTTPDMVSFPDPSPDREAIVLEEDFIEIREPLW